MKKTACLLVFSALILNACHSGNKPATTTAITSNDVDTSKIKALPQQAPDTSIKKDGVFIRRYANGIMKERSYYVGGRRQGECQSFYPNGKLWSDDNFRNGVLDGGASSYYDNGQKRYEGAYIKGKPSGTWVFYDEAGKEVRSVNYGKRDSKPAM